MEIMSKHKCVGCGSNEIVVKCPVGNCKNYFCGICECHDGKRSICERCYDIGEKKVKVKMKVTTFQMDRREIVKLRGNYYRLGEVYIEDQRPMEKGGTILDDIEWRRNHDVPFRPDIIEDNIIAELEKRGYPSSHLDIKYSTKAGCTMCPCSPGYIVRVRQDFVEGSLLKAKFSIWLKEVKS